MFPTSVCNILVKGKNVSSILFRAAIHYAKEGLQVWFILPETIQAIPNDIEIPDKEVLKLLTFLYLKDDTDLINHLNSANTWHRSPNVIILTEFEKYLKEYDASIIAYLWSILINSSRVLAEKHKINAKIILSCNFEENIEILSKIYFKHSITANNEVNECVEKIINALK